MPEIKNCLSCKWEPEWFEDMDQFNPCPHCNTRTVGICKKLALIVPILGQPACWPDAMINAYSWVERQGDRISRCKPHSFPIRDCPAHEPAEVREGRTAVDLEQDIHDFFPKKPILWVKAMNCLLSKDIRTVGDLIKKSESDLKRIRNCGVSIIAFISEALAEHGLKLRETEGEPCPKDQE